MLIIKLVKLLGWYLPYNALLYEKYKRKFCQVCFTKKVGISFKILKHHHVLSKRKLLSEYNTLRFSHEVAAMNEASNNQGLTSIKFRLGVFSNPLKTFTNMILDGDHSKHAVELKARKLKLHAPIFSFNLLQASIC